MFVLCLCVVFCFVVLFCFYSRYVDSRLFSLRFVLYCIVVFANCCLYVILLWCVCVMFVLCCLLHWFVCLFVCFLPLRKPLKPPFPPPALSTLNTVQGCITATCLAARCDG